MPSAVRKEFVGDTSSEDSLPRCPQHSKNPFAWVYEDGLVVRALDDILGPWQWTTEKRGHGSNAKTYVTAKATAKPSPVKLFDELDES
jgi:hypothetical protein